MYVHSKGTWTLDNSNGEISAEGVKVCKVYGATVHNVEDNASECVANARLIENSPKMLHALKKANSFLALHVWTQTLAGEIQELIDSIEGEEASHDQRV